MAESGRSGAVEYLGEIANDPGAISKLCDRLGRPGKPLAFCYEAGPRGYGVHRQLTSLGHRCDVVAVLPAASVAAVDGVGCGGGRVDDDIINEGAVEEDFDAEILSALGAVIIAP